MQTHLTALAHASVLQLRDALRRVTALHGPSVTTVRCEPKSAVEIDARASARDAWEETTFDVRHIHA